MDIWNDEWETNENEENIIRAKQRAHALTVVGCLAITLSPLFIFAGLFFLFYLEITGDTVIMESTSPNGEYTLIVKKNNSHLHHQTFIVETEDGSQLGISTELEANQLENPVSIEWYGDNKATIEFEYPVSNGTIEFAAPNTLSLD